MVDLMHCPANLLFFDVTLLYCYTNLNSSIICCLFSGDVYLSFGTSISSLASMFYSSFEEFWEISVILSAILLAVKSPVASAVFELIFLKQFLLHLL